tara:strand:+ start:423 stop:668 length:246 start_codon:yes stop_codon:yes gene_type:complete
MLPESTARVIATGVVTAIRARGGVVTACGIHPAETGLTITATVNGRSVRADCPDQFVAYQTVAEGLLATALAAPPSLVVES